MLHNKHLLNYKLIKSSLLYLYCPEYSLGWTNIYLHPLFDMHYKQCLCLGKKVMPLGYLRDTFWHLGGPLGIHWGCIGGGYFKDNF